jgi:RNA polymerase sigma-70 factor, ECF subfamily
MDWDWDDLRRRCVLDARGHGLNAADAEDAAQEALLRAWRARAQCRTPDAPESWVRVIGRREAWRMLGARRDDVQHDAQESFADASDFTVAVQLRLDIARAFDVLSDEDRALLAARYMLELGQTEIARLHGMPGGTAAVRLHRARGRMRVALTATYGQAN